MPHVERLNHGTVTQDQNENAERLLRPRRTALSVMWAEFSVFSVADISNFVPFFYVSRQR